MLKFSHSSVPEGSKRGSQNSYLMLWLKADNEMKNSRIRWKKAINNQHRQTHRREFESLWNCRKLKVWRDFSAHDWKLKLIMPVLAIKQYVRHDVAKYSRDPRHNLNGFINVSNINRFHSKHCRTSTSTGTSTRVRLPRQKCSYITTITRIMAKQEYCTIKWPFCDRLGHIYTKTLTSDYERLRNRCMTLIENRKVNFEMTLIAKRK